MNISVLLVEPKLKSDFIKELEDCIVQLKSENLSNRVISTTVFLNATDYEGYETYKKIASAALSKQFSNILSVNYVCQPPAKGDQIAFEIHLIDEKDCILNYVEYNGCHYVRAISGNLLKGIFVSGIQCNYNDGALVAFDKVFSTMEEILSREGLSFNSIVRQWNYIENILQEISKENLKKQHYQIFNDVRTKYYNKVSFKSGYPAATGIGVTAGGVAISFYALSESSDIQIFPIDNPLQQPAFEYPVEVLVGESSVDFCEKTTPKFVRAKHIESGSTHITFISGTAAIRLEKTVGIHNILEQIKITIENIEHLISQTNFENVGINNSEKEKVIYYRAYVKNTLHLKKIIQKCEELLPGIPYIFLVSDICRRDLLIEIEAFSS